MPRARKKPMRQCIGCQEMKSKKELIRVVRTPENKLELDASGKKPGRGAYLCSNGQCLEKAIKGRRLEKSLKQKVSNEVYDMLQQELGKHD